MQTITTIGLDIAKSVFQVHGVDAVGQAVIRRQLKRRYVLTFPDRNFNMRTMPGFPALPKTSRDPVRTRRQSHHRPLRVLIVFIWLR